MNSPSPDPDKEYEAWLWKVLDATPHRPDTKRRSEPAPPWRRDADPLSMDDV